MTVQSVSLNLPSPLYDQLKRPADQARRTQERIEELLEKQQAEALTPAEKRKLLQYEELDDFLSLVNRLLRNLMQSNGKDVVHAPATKDFRVAPRGCSSASRPSLQTQMRPKRASGLSHGLHLTVR